MISCIIQRIFFLDGIFHHFRKSRGPRASRTCADQGPHIVVHNEIVSKLPKRKKYQWLSTKIDGETSVFHREKIEEPTEFRIFNDPLHFRAFSRRGAKSGKCVSKKFFNFEVVVVVFYLFAEILIVQWPIRTTDKKQNGKKKLKISIVPDPRFLVLW